MLFSAVAAIIRSSQLSSSALGPGLERIVPAYRLRGATGGPFGASIQAQKGRERREIKSKVRREGLGCCLGPGLIPWSGKKTGAPRVKSLQFSLPPCGLRTSQEGEASLVCVCVGGVSFKTLVRTGQSTDKNI